MAHEERTSIILFWQQTLSTHLTKQCHQPDVPRARAGEDALQMLPPLDTASGCLSSAPRGMQKRSLQHSLRWLENSVNNLKAITRKMVKITTPTRTILHVIES